MYDIAKTTLGCICLIADLAWFSAPHDFTALTIALALFVEWSLPGLYLGLSAQGPLYAVVLAANMLLTVALAGVGGALIGSGMRKQIKRLRQ
jgi:hypothetical protein